MVKLFLVAFVSVCFLFGGEYSLRGYSHVKKFYKELAPLALEIGLEYNIPPASLLAIAGVESGYGSGYVAQISGNVLSLGANKNDTMLPPLYLPYSKEKKKILFKPAEIQKQPQSDLSYKTRAKSLKKDYRPKAIAGSAKELDYFSGHPAAKSKAHRENLKDFASLWISKNARFEPFRQAREYLDGAVAKGGKKVLFDPKLNVDFVDLVGGRPHSFNYRKSWPKKVKYLLRRAGLVELMKAMQEGESFEKAWAAQ